MNETAGNTGGTGPVFDNEMAEILESFIVETREILERLGQDLMLLEKGNAGGELLNTIFRAVHTIKGTSSFLGLEQMTELAHVFEDVLNKLRRGEITMNSGKMDVMLEAYDIIKELLLQIEEKNIRRIDLTGVVARLRVIGQVGGTPAGVSRVSRLPLHRSRVSAPRSRRLLKQGLPLIARCPHVRCSRGTGGGFG